MKLMRKPQPRHHRNISAITWVPQAVIGVPISYLEEKNGLRFSKGNDDLDTFMGSEMLEVKGHEYLLRQYRGYPPDQIEVCLPFEVSDAKEIKRLVDAIIDQLHVSPAKVTWHRGTGTSASR